jgi:Mrp family chromosome partitioning ATPase
MEEETYRQLERSLEKARVDETLDPTRMPNISTVQKPSAPVPVVEELNQKLIKGLAAGGILLGLGLAFLIELVVDPSVKRPGELERHHRIPVLFSVPRIAARQRRLLPGTAGTAPDAAGNLPVPAPDSAKSAWLPGHFIRPFCDSIRDRLILYFQIKSMTHKPKLVAVAGCAGGEGTSTLAGGLAASLSETGDGKVLLVNMNAGEEQVHPFFNGKIAGSIEEALELGHSEPLNGNNLFMTAGDIQGRGPITLAPKKFYDILPNLKASDFDYIIFDMPPLAESSATLAMAGFMDKMLLVVESGKTSKHLVKRTYSELLAAKADVSCIFNRTPTNLPKFLEA